MGSIADMWIEVDTTGQPERSLLAQVVLLALNDACQPPLKIDKQWRLSTNSFTAMRFIFDTSSSGLNEFCAWLEMDPDSFRRHLLASMADLSPKQIGEWDSMKRRYFRQNYALWQAMKGVDIPDEEDDNDDA